MLSACDVSVPPPAAAPSQSTTPPPPTSPVAAAEPAPPPTAAPETEPPPPSPARRRADALTAVERAIRDDGVDGATLADAASRQQRLYRALAQRNRWPRGVVRRVGADVRPAVRANLRAARELAALVTPQPRLPDWRIVEPAPAEELLAHYRRAEAESGIPWGYLAAINLVETRMGRIRGTSTAGAQGPMQFLPATWDTYGRGDINDDGDAIAAAARHLAAHGGPQDMARALWHYNPTDRYVTAVTAYAQVMLADPRAYRGYYHWQVYYRTVDGDVLLPVGYRG